MTTKATCSSRYNHFFANNPLYDSVFTQYGPFYFETMRFLFAVASVEVGHDAGRIVTLAFWIAAALALGLASFIATGRLTGWTGRATHRFYRAIRDGGMSQCIPEA